MDDLDNAAALLDRLEAAGLTAQVVDGTLLIGPPDRLTPGLRAAIRDYRDTIMSLLVSARPLPALDVNPLTRDRDDLATRIAMNTLVDHARLREAEALADELFQAGPSAIAAMRWLARYPVDGNALDDHVAALLAVRLAGDRSRPPGELI